MLYSRSTVKVNDENTEIPWQTKQEFMKALVDSRFKNDRD